MLPPRPVSYSAKPLSLRRRGAKILDSSCQESLGSRERQLHHFGQFSRMLTYYALTGLLACFFSYASATALTYKLVASEKACFFSNVEQQGAKIAFYFAVSRSIFAPRAIAMSRCRRSLYTLLRVGPIRRLLRCRLHSHGPRWENHHGELEGAAIGLRVHGQDDGRIQLLLQQ